MSFTLRVVRLNPLEENGLGRQAPRCWPLHLYNPRHYAPATTGAGLLRYVCNKKFQKAIGRMRAQLNDIDFHNVSQSPLRS
jgi:hypothetical protein